MLLFGASLALSPARSTSRSTDWASLAARRAASVGSELGLPALSATVLCTQPPVALVRGLLTADECAGVVVEVGASGLLRPSRVRRDDGRGYGVDPSVRDSLECVWAPDGVMALPDGALPVLVAQRLHRLLGDVARPDHVEGPKVVKYGASQHYSEHLDWGAGLAAAPAGQRTATALLYLSSLDGEREGGCTVFPRLGLRVAPEAGSALVWSNLTPDGEGDRSTLHGSEPTLAGARDKWVCNYFYRERSFFELAVEAARAVEGV